MRYRIKPADLKGNVKVKRPKYLSYWIASVSYFIIFSLTIFFLVAYVPNLVDRTYSTTLTFLIVFLLAATVAFAWETLQWRKKRAAEGRPSIEDIIKEAKEKGDI